MMNIKYIGLLRLLGPYEDSYLMKMYCTPFLKLGLSWNAGSARKRTISKYLKRVGLAMEFESGNRGTQNSYGNRHRLQKREPKGR